jgi:membrane protein required for beta-lactamase induction
MGKGENRKAGILYLGVMVLGVIAQIIRSDILVFDNDVNTLEKINSSIFLLRLAFICDLLMTVVFLLTVWTLYNILKNVNKNQSLLFLIFTIISVSIMCMNMINHIAIIEINNSEYFNANNNYDLKSLSQLFSKLHTYGYLIAQIFFGFGCCRLDI